MQARFGESFAGLEMKIADGPIAFDGGGVAGGMQLGQQQQRIGQSRFAGGTVSTVCRRVGVRRRPGACPPSCRQQFLIIKLRLARRRKRASASSLAEMRRASRLRQDRENQREQHHKSDGVDRVFIRPGGLTDIGDQRRRGNRPLQNPIPKEHSPGFRRRAWARRNRPSSTGRIP